MAETMTLEGLIQYGGIGIVLMYFLIKDWRSTKLLGEFKDSLDSFKEVLLRMEGRLAKDE